MTGIFDAAVTHFGLGTCLSAQTVPGGLSNELWRLETSGGGTVAMKVMVANAEAPEFRGNIEAAFAIEQNAFRQGVPCPEPIALSTGGCLALVEGRYVRVHRWAEGQTPTASRLPEMQAGVLLAQIHAASPSRMLTLDDEPWDVESWAGLSQHLNMPADAGDQLRSAARSLAELEAATAAPGLVVPHVPSHGDLDPKNTLMVGDQLLALDWDAARVQSVAREAAGVALDWSTDPESFQRVLSAYTQASGIEIPREPWVLGGWVSALGGWLVYNATERMDTEIGHHETKTTCERLLALHASMNRYLTT